jgi:hypothetical protein
VLTVALALGATIVGAVVASIGVRVQFLPDVIDISFVLTGAGLGSLLAAFLGALWRFDPDRLGRVTLLGTLLGGIVALLVLLLALLADVLS